MATMPASSPGPFGCEPRSVVGARHPVADGYGARPSADARVVEVGWPRAPARSSDLVGGQGRRAPAAPSQMLWKDRRARQPGFPCRRSGAAGAGGDLRHRPARVRPVRADVPGRVRPVPGRAGLLRQCRPGRLPRGHRGHRCRRGPLWASCAGGVGVSAGGGRRGRYGVCGWPDAAGRGGRRGRDERRRGVGAVLGRGRQPGAIDWEEACPGAGQCRFADRVGGRQRVRAGRGGPMAGRVVGVRGGRSARGRGELEGAGTGFDGAGPRARRASAGVVPQRPVDATVRRHIGGIDHLWCLLRLRA